MISYLLEASICLIGFYGFYWLFLRSEKLLSINRFYLLITSCISIILPLLDFKVGSNIFTPDRQLSVGGTSTQEVVSNAQSLSVESVYFIGLAISALLFVIRLLIVKKRVGSNFSFKRKKLTIVETDGREAYSFFNTVFIGKSIINDPKLKNQILAHEIAHVKGMHLLDLMYFEFVKCLFWFNPFSYFYSKSIKLQHEYIADQNALESTNPETYENSLVEFTLSKVNTSLISSFGQHPIQKRLNMIYKLNSNIMNKLKPLFALPLFAILFASFACSEEANPVLDTPENEKSENGEIELIVEELPIDESKKREILTGKLFELEEIVVEELHQSGQGQVLKIQDANGEEYEVEVVEEQRATLQKAMGQIKEVEIPLVVESVRAEPRKKN